MSTLSSQKGITGLSRFREDSFCHQDTNEPVTGTYEQYHDNGQLECKKAFIDGELEGLVEWFRENGQLEYRGNYKDGKEDGPYETFYENGQLNSRGNFIDGELDGLFERFDEVGNLIKTELWENGKIIE